MSNGPFQGVCADHNLLLNALSDADFARVTSTGQEVLLEAKAVLYDADDVIRSMYFICDGIASISAEMQDGRTTEILSIGREGMVGLPSLMGTTRKRFRATMTVSGSAWRIPAEDVAALFRSDSYFSVIMRRYMQARLFQASQLAACNLLHSVEQRLSRWLLTAQDQLGQRPIPVTHETIADLLGAQRSTISTTASNLERAGVIAYKRGQITIPDRPRLLATACECYTAIRQRFTEVLG